MGTQHAGTHSTTACQARWTSLRMQCFIYSTRKTINNKIQLVVIKHDHRQPNDPPSTCVRLVHAGTAACAMHTGRLLSD